MTNGGFELPLSFAGHVARIVVTPLAKGGWQVCTEVDGRVLGWEQFVHKAQIDRFRERMQNWIRQVEDTERRLASAA